MKAITVNEITAFFNAFIFAETDVAGFLSIETMLQRVIKRGLTNQNEIIDILCYCINITAEQQGFNNSPVFLLLLFFLSFFFFSPTLHCTVTLHCCRRGHVMCSVSEKFQEVRLEKRWV